jgi:hypothetical protein
MNVPSELQPMADIDPGAGTRGDGRPVRDDAGHGRHRRRRPTRRRLLATLPVALSGLAGCSGGFGLGGGSDPDPGTPTPGAATGRSDAGDGAGSTTPGEGEPSGTPGEGTPTATPPRSTPTLTAAPAPPGDALRLDAERTTLDARRDDYYTGFAAAIVLENVGDLTFDRIELRVDVRFVPPGGGDPFAVATAYVDRRTFGGDSPETLAPGESTTLSLRPDRLRFERDGRAQGSTDDDDFDLDLTFRRVEYRPATTATPTPAGD